MKAVFFGHRDAPSEVRPALKAVVEQLMKEGVREFCVGNNGNFDFLVQSVLKEIVDKREDASCSICLSRLDEQALCGDQSLTVFLEGLEGTPPRFAIARRNDLMLKRATYGVAYVKHTPSYSANFVRKAERKGISVINLALLLP